MTFSPNVCLLYARSVIVRYQERSMFNIVTIFFRSCGSMVSTNSRVSAKYSLFNLDALAIGI